MKEVTVLLQYTENEYKFTNFKYFLVSGTNDKEMPCMYLTIWPLCADLKRLITIVIIVRETKHFEVLKTVTSTE